MRRAVFVLFSLLACLFVLFVYFFVSLVVCLAGSEGDGTHQQVAADALQLRVRFVLVLGQPPKRLPQLQADEGWMVGVCGNVSN